MHLHPAVSYTHAIIWCISLNQIHKKRPAACRTYQGLIPLYHGLLLYPLHPSHRPPAETPRELRPGSCTWTVLPKNHTIGRTNYARVQAVATNSRVHDREYPRNNVCRRSTICDEPPSCMTTSVPTPSLNTPGIRQAIRRRAQLNMFIIPGRSGEPRCGGRHSRH